MMRSRSNGDRFPASNALVLVSSHLFFILNTPPPSPLLLLLFSFLARLTHNDDLDQAHEKVKVGRQIASKLSALFLCGNSGSSATSLNLSVVSLSLFVSVFSWYETCTSGRTGSRVGEMGGRVGCWLSILLWSLRSDRRLSESWRLESKRQPEWHFSTDQHEPAVCVCVFWIICVFWWTVSECLLMVSAVLKDCWLLAAVCLCTKGITSHNMKNRITYFVSHQTIVPLGCRATADSPIIYMQNVSVTQPLSHCCKICPSISVYFPGRINQRKWFVRTL